MIDKSLETILCVDMSNLLHKTFYVNAKEKEEDLIVLAYHTSLITLNKYHKLYKPSQTVFVFDRGNWRKDYTSDPELCYSGKLYKGQRRQNMTPAQQRRYAHYLTFMNDFEQLMRDHTGITCLAGEGLEADDLIAGIAQVYAESAHIVIITADKDMMQLLRYPNVELVDPTTGKNRTLAEWNDDPDFFLFSKCIRGDTGDNVQSAYPRVRDTKIIEAYNDPYKRINMMKETWTNQNNTTLEVGKMFDENELLMDLSKQPTCIRRKILEVIEYEMENRGRFSHFHFSKFIGKYQLKSVSKQLSNLIPLLVG
jgi:hypothetical protein